MDGFRYHAFISYSHADEAWARWLHRALETYRVPARLRRGAASGMPKRLFPIFRDRDELPSAAELGAVIQQALRDSRTLIVVCSPRAAASRWVNEEIRYFKSLGRERQVFALIVDGEPHATDAVEECFPLVLSRALTEAGDISEQPVEPIAADAREGRDGRRDGLLKLIAGLLGVGFDELRQRERRRRLWQRARYATAGLAGLALLLGAWQWFERYQRAQALEQRVERLYENGRLALLDQQMARAAVYLAEAYKLGRDTPALRLMLSQALQSVEALHPVKGNAGGFVRRPEFSPDDREFITPVTGEKSGSAVIWDTQSRRERVRLQGLPAMPHITRYLPDGQRILISGFAQSSNYSQQGAQTGVWDVRTGQRLLMQPGHSGHFGMPFANDGQRFLTADEPDFPGVRIRSLDNGEVLHVLAHAKPVRAASFSPDGRWVLSGDDAGQVRLWDSTATTKPRLLHGPTPSAIVGILVAPDSRRAIAISRKGDVRVWSLPAGDLLLAFGADKSFIADTAMDASGSRLLSVGRQGYKVWDMERGTLLFARDGELDWGSAGAISPNGRILTVADTNDTRIHLIDLVSRRTLASLEFSADAASAGIFGRRGTSLLVGSESGRLSVIDPLPGPTLEVDHPPSLYEVVLSPDEDQLVTVGYDPAVKLWDRHGGQLLRILNGHAKRVLQARYSEDATRLVTASEDGTLGFWAAKSGALTATASAHAVGVVKLITAPSSDLVLSLPYPAQQEDTTAKLWDIRSGRMLGVLPHPAVVRTAVFSPDGRRLATAAADGVLRVWTGASPFSLLGEFAIAKGELIALNYRADGGRLLALDYAGSAVLVDPNSGAVVDRFHTPPDDPPVIAAASAKGDEWAFATELGTIWVREDRDGKWRALPTTGHRLISLRYLKAGLLLSSGYDGSIRAWDTRRREDIAIIGGHDRGAWSMWPTGDDRQLFTAGLEGLARAWRLLPGDPPDIRSIDRALCQLPLALAEGDRIRITAARQCP